MKHRLSEAAFHYSTDEKFTLNANKCCVHLDYRWL